MRKMKVKETLTSPMHFVTSAIWTLPQDKSKESTDFSNSWKIEYGFHFQYIF